MLISRKDQGYHQLACLVGDHLWEFMCKGVLKALGWLSGWRAENIGVMGNAYFRVQLPFME